MTLEQVITKVPNWDTLTREALLEALTTKNQLYQNLKKFNLIDIAKVIGVVNMNNFLEAVTAANLSWMIQQATTDFTPGDDPSNAELRKVDNVFAQQLANHTRRMVSLLELYQLPTPSLQEVWMAQYALKLVQEIQQMDDEATDRLYRYRENLNRWDGNPLTRPIL